MSSRWHAGERRCSIVEVKTRIGDVQATASDVRAEGPRPARVSARGRLGRRRRSPGSWSSPTRTAIATSFATTGDLRRGWPARTVRDAGAGSARPATSDAPAIARGFGGIWFVAVTRTPAARCRRGFARRRARRVRRLSADRIGVIDLVRRAATQALDRGPPGELRRLRREGAAVVRRLRPRARRAPRGAGRRADRAARRPPGPAAAARVVRPVQRRRSAPPSTPSSTAASNGWPSRSGRRSRGAGHGSASARTSSRTSRSTPTGRATRGYDQAELIARAAARHLGLPYAPLLARERATIAQFDLDRRDRAANVAGAFARAARAAAAATSAVAGSCSSTTSSRPARRWRPAPTPWSAPARSARPRSPWPASDERRRRPGAILDARRPAPGR